MRIVLACTALLICGCAHVTPVSGPDGKPALAIRCGIKQESCYQAAGEHCPNGYNLLDSGNGSAVVGTRYGLAGGSHRTMLIQCK